MYIEEYDFIEYHNQSIDYDKVDGCYGVIVSANPVTNRVTETLHLFKHKLDAFDFAFNLMHKRPFDLCIIKNDEVIIF